jgi:hypothetical protein
MPYLNAEEMLAGGSLVFDVEIPDDVLRPDGNGTSGEVDAAEPSRVKLRPLTVRMVQQITRAAKDNDALLSALLIKESMVEPALNFDQVHGLHTGLARFLLDEVNRISGMQLPEQKVRELVQTPLAKACFALAREFGWTPQEVGELTMAQVMMYVEMLRGTKPAEVEVAAR